MSLNSFARLVTGGYTSDQKHCTTYTKGALLILALVALCLLLVALFPLAQQELHAPPASPAYEFNTGVNHPQEIKDLLKNGTVVLYFYEDNCPFCKKMAPKMTDLQSQYNGSDVTFAHINIRDDNASSRNVTRNYGITGVPTILIIRRDGAVANFTGANTGINTVKSAIDDAQRWGPTPTPIFNWPF